MDVATQARGTVAPGEAKRRWLPFTARIRDYLIVLTLLATLPIAGFVLLVMSELQGDEEAALAARTGRQAQGIASAVAQQLRDMSTTLSVLSSSPEIEAGDFHSFHARAQRALQSSGWFALLVDADGRQILNTRVPFDLRLGPTSSPQSLAAARAAHGIHVSEVFHGRTSGTWVFNVTLPLPRSATVPDGALILTQNASSFRDLIDARSLAEGWHYALMDGAGRTIAMSVAAEPGAPFTVPGLELEASTGAVRSIDPGIVAADAVVAGSAWRAVVWGPVGIAQTHILQSWSALLYGGVGFVLFSLALGLVFGRHLGRPATALSRLAERVGAGETVDPIETRIAEFDAVSGALAEASRRRRDDEARIRFVLSELSHRMGNLLTVIQVLVRQSAKQSRTVEELQGALANRLAALGQSVKVLSTQNWGDVPLRRLIEAQLEVFVDAVTRVELSGPEIRIRADAANNLGMIIHELATNATKYGALSTPFGRVRVDWSLGGPKDAAVGDALCLVWCEQRGPEVAEPAREGFGTQLVRSLSRSLKGSAVAEYHADGVVWTVTVATEAVQVPD